MSHKKESKSWKPKVGDKVWLPANPKEGWPDEFGKVIDIDDKSATLGIQLDKKYITEKGDDGIRESGIDGVRPISEFKSNQVTSKQVTKTKNKKVMKKVAKKSASKVSKSNGKGAKKTAKKAAANRPAAKRSDSALTRKEASEKLKISIYAVDQALLKKELKSLEEADVMKYKKVLK